MASGSSSPDARIARLAAKQHGLITRRQALDCGFSRSAIDHRVGSRRWVSMHPGVYRINGAVESWRQRVLAACLSAGEGAVASHLTAGVLWGVVERKDVPIEVTVSFASHPAGLGFSVHRSRLGVGRSGRIDGVPGTSPARTLVDLASVVSRDELEEALDGALRRRLVRCEDVRSEVVRLLGSGRRGTAKVAQLLSERGQGAPSESVFETRFCRMMVRTGLPMPERQYEVRRGGILIARVDLAYPRERIAIELDGYRDHSSRQAFERDRVRQNDLQRAGYTVLRFTWADLRRSAHVRDVVLRILWERGHPDVVSV